MSNKNIKTPYLWDNITLLSDNLSSSSISISIANQINETNITNKILLQQISENIYFLTIKKDNKKNSLEIKKISDRVQYSVLPNLCTEENFIRLSINKIKNYNYDKEAPSWYTKEIDNQPSFKKVLMFFYYQKDTLVKKLYSSFQAHKLDAFALEEETVKISNGIWNHKINTSEIISFSIWENKPTKEIIEFLIADVKIKMLFYDQLHKNLNEIYSTTKWTLLDGQLSYENNGITKKIDYQEIAKDIYFCNFEKKVLEYLKAFNIENISILPWFPNITVRSPIYLKVRPNVLCEENEGFVYCANKEFQEKQTIVKAKNQQTNLEFKLWKKRVFKNISQHSYKARVITCGHKEVHAVALIGEMISSIAVFPELLKGALEELDVNFKGIVKLTAHSENTLVIANSESTWGEVASLSEKANELFNMIHADGCDPLELYREVTLPQSGAGQFNFKVVPQSFFKLIDTAIKLKNSIPSGHNHYLFGLAYQCLHEPVLAINEFKKALRFDSSDADVLNALGNGFKDLGNYQEAFPFLKKAFDILPRNAEVANDLGETSFEIGDIGSAISAFERAVELQPAQVTYLVNLGRVYIDSDRENDALSLLNEALRCDPAYAQAHEALAILYKKQGQKELAKKHALLAYDANPISPSIANLLWQLTIESKNS